MPQLIAMAFHKGIPACFKFPYQANVINIFENRRSVIVRVIKKG